MLKDLRSFLKLLEDKGDLVHITDPVSPCYEVAAGIRKTSDIQGPALWFDNVIGHSMPVVGGLYAARRRAIWGFEANEAEVFKKFTKGLKQPIPPRIVSDGPCKEVILTDQDADFSRLSICTHNRRDAGPFITLGLQMLGILTTATMSPLVGCRYLTGRPPVFGVSRRNNWGYISPILKSKVNLWKSP